MLVIVSDFFHLWAAERCSFVVFLVIWCVFFFPAFIFVLGFDNGGDIQLPLAVTFWVHPFGIYHTVCLAS